MATSNSNRTTRLAVEIETTGQAGLKQAASEFRNLAKEGGDAAPAFQRAADELERLSEQAQSVDGLKTLAGEVERLAAAQVDAADTALRLRTALDQQKVATEGARQRQQELQAAVDQADRAFNAARAAVRELRAETSAAEKNTADYTIQLSTLVRLQNEAQLSLQEQKRALREAGAAARDAAAEERQANAAYEKSATALRAATTALQERRAVQQQAQAGAVALGVATEDLAAAEAKLRDEIQRTYAAGKLQYELTQAQTVADQLAAAEAQALANARRVGAEAAQSELLAIKESEQFVERYAAAQRAAANEALRFVEAEEAAAAAAEKAARRMAELNATAEQTARAARYVREVEAALAAADAEAKQAAESLRKFTTDTVSAGRSLNDAFGATGVRSLQAIEAEIRQVDLATSKLQRSFAAGEISAQDLARALSSATVRLATLKREMETVPALPGAFERINASINDVIGKFGSLTAALATVGIAIKPILDAEIALERVRRTLTTVTGSAAEAGKQIEFIRNVAQRSGQTFDELAISYSKFAASALQVGIKTKDVQDVFAAVALASGNLGLSTDQAGRALEALSQIASKGVVSMEELRQQLGDALPGILPALAKELGLTDAELNKVVESGKLLAFEAIPAIGRAVGKLGPEAGKQVSGLVAEWNRLKNVLTEVSTLFTDGAFGQAIGGVLSTVSGIIGLATLKTAQFAESWVVAGKTIGAALEAVRSGDLKTFRETIDEITAESRTKLEGLASRIEGTGKAASAATPAVAGLTDAVRAAATDAGKTAEAADASAKSFASLALASQKVIDQADANASAAEKMAQARKDEAESIKTVIALSGDEIALKRVAAEQDTAYAAALERQAQADAAALDARREARQLLIAEAAARGVATERIKDQVQALDEEILKLAGTAEKSEQAAEKQKALALASKLAAETFKDNAGNYDTFRDAVDGAERAYEGVRRAFQRGKATTEDLTKAERDLAVAKRLLRDAIDDQLTRAERLGAALQLEAEWTNKLLAVDIAKLKVDAEKLRQQGLETAARQLDIKIAELELTTTQNTTAAKRAEANEIIRSLTLRKAELEAIGQLTPELRFEIDQRIRKAQIVTLEADATNVATKAEEEHLKAVRNGTEDLDKNTQSKAGNTAATDSSTASTDKNTKSRLENADAISKQTSAQQKYLDLLINDPGRLVGGNGLGGIVDRQEQRDLKPALTLPSGLEIGKGSTLSPNWWNDNRVLFVPGQTPQALSATPFGGGSGGANSLLAAPFGRVPAAPAPAPAPQSSSTKTLKIEIGGQTRTIDFANQASADEFMRMFEDDFKALGLTVGG